MVTRVLDLFSGAGGAAVGYYRAFGPDCEIVGVDIVLQPRYPFRFVQADALEYVAEHGGEFDFIHASPPCQDYSRTRAIHGKEYPRLVSATRRALAATARPYVIEMVTPDPLEGNIVMLCGAMFGLKVYRHRFFECSVFFLAPPHMPHWNGTTAPRGSYDRGEGGVITVAGHNFSPPVARQAMDIAWMNGHELAQAIPPAYTEWLGRQLLAAMGGIE